MPTIREGDAVVGRIECSQELLCRLIPFLQVPLGNGLVESFLLRDGSFPWGLASKIVHSARCLGVRVESRAPLFCEVPDIPEGLLEGIRLRPYQIDALRIWLRRPRGVLECPTGSGKGLLAAAVLRLSEGSALYVVPSTKALLQARRVLLSSGIAPRSVGRLGGGFTETGRRITVAVINSAYRLAMARKLGQVSLLILDEVHHERAHMWRIVALSCSRAHRRLGLSATPWKCPQNTYFPSVPEVADWWLHALVGPTVYRLETTSLQREGMLAPLEVLSFPGGGTRFASKKWREILRRGIVENSVRNQRIVSLSASLLGEGRTPLILVDRTSHGAILQSELTRRKVPSIAAYGQEAFYAPLFLGLEGRRLPARKYWRGQLASLDARSYLGEHTRLSVDDLPMLLNGTRAVVIGSSVFDEAVDIPGLTDLVLAAGGQSSQRYYQRVGRILRVHAQKDVARLWDPYDTVHRSLERHSRGRLRHARKKGFSYRGMSIRCLSDDRIHHNLQGKNMRFDEIEISVGMTIPTAQFSNVKPEVRLRAVIEEGDDPSEVAEKVSKAVGQLFTIEAHKQARLFGLYGKGFESAVEDYGELASDYIGRFVIPSSEE